MKIEVGIFLKKRTPTVIQYLSVQVVDKTTGINPWIIKWSRADGTTAITHWSEKGIQSEFIIDEISKVKQILKQYGV
jgi:hypothetical protein